MEACKGPQGPVKDLSLHAVMEMTDQRDESVRASKLTHDAAEAVAADVIEGFGQVHTMSMVSRSFQKPHWLSGIRPFSRCSMRQFGRILARTFPAMQRSDIPLWLSQACLLPFHL